MPPGTDRQDGVRTVQAITPLIVYNSSMLTLAIQAGGQSTRMGRDKGLVEFLGKPLITRVMGRLAPLADEVIVTTNAPESYRFLGVPLYADLKPGRGALGGLHTALACATHPLVAVVACDMPFASAGLLTFARDLLLESDDDVAIPESVDGWFEPLHAVYRREVCLPAIAQAIDADQWKLISWFPQVKVRRITSAEVVRLDPSGMAFSNVNTPEELAQAEQRARES
jgi:molybdopterin-guanine dinucleotide biosynthesis protein A